MFNRSVLLCILLAFSTALTTTRDCLAAGKPNIIVIYTDDLGYGDVGCYGAKLVKTPAIDKLAADGIRFTDGHSPAATCTPSRYALLTGEYAWRKRGTGILPGDAAAIIKPGRATVASVLKSAGYATGAVGKWHLGLGDGNVDWNGDIKPGPLEIGFDYCFLVPATGDRVPCVYVENHRVVGLDPNDPIKVSYKAKVGDDPTGKQHPELLKYKFSHGHDMTIVNGISRIGWMTGGKSARWVDEDMADTLTAKATAFIEKHKSESFFLYFATHDIHVPRMPHARFAGTSGCGIRGDVIHQTDWCVGQIMATLDRLKLTDNTLVVFTSDNGPVIDDGYADGSVVNLNGHNAAGPLRGGKYSRFEGGTRVPFIAHWPARIKPGVSDALMCQIDFLATFAAIAEQKLPDGAGPDSENHLAALVGESPTGRQVLVEQGNGLALRKGAMKYLPAGQPRSKVGKKDAPAGELYNLADDLAESNNLAAKETDTLKAMDALLDSIRRADDEP